MTHFAQAERVALCETVSALGPDVPTLCGSWRTRDLLAHLVIRESRPDLAVGMFVPQLADRLDQAMAEKAQQEWPELLEEFRGGPPVWNPTRFGPVHELVNVLEFFVHHEDVLRAQPDWTPRSLRVDQEKSLWMHLRQAAGMLYRRAPVGVILVADKVGRQPVRQAGDRGVVVMRAPVAELVMYSYGRKEQATVKISGPSEAVSALRATQLSI